MEADRVTNPCPREETRSGQRLEGVESNGSLALEDQIIAPEKDADGLNI